MARPARQRGESWRLRLRGGNPDQAAPLRRFATPPPPCGARKTHRAYADPRVFRPLRKKHHRFFCPRQRDGAFPPSRGEASMRCNSPSRGRSPYRPSATSARRAAASEGEARGRWPDLSLRSEWHSGGMIQRKNAPSEIRGSVKLVRFVRISPARKAGERSGGSA